MGTLQGYTDPTGTMSDLEIAQQNISMITDELNKLQDTQSAHFQQTDVSLIINDGTNNRIIIGQFPDGNYGIVISKPGIDVNSIFS